VVTVVLKPECRRDARRYSLLMPSTIESRLDDYSSAVISLFRVVMGFLFTVSGMSGLFGWPVAYGDAPPIGSFPN